MTAMNASISPTTLDAERRSHEPSMEEILASIRRIIADDDALPAMRREREKDRRAAPLADAPKQAEPRLAPPVVAAPESSRPAPEPVRPSAAALASIDEPDSAPPIVEAPAPTESDDYWLRGRQRPAARLSANEDQEPAEEQNRWAIDAEEDLTPEENLAPEEEEDAFPAAMREDDRSERHEAAAASEPEKEEDEDASADLVSTDAASSIASHFQALAASIMISESDLIERYARDQLRPLLKQWLDDNLPHIVEKLVRAEIERVARGRR